MERFDMEKLYEKVGGAFRLTVLVQKRLKQLSSGIQPLVNIDSKNLKEIVYKEILEDKISLIEDLAIESSEEDNVGNVEDMFRRRENSESFELPFK